MPDHDIDDDMGWQAIAEEADRQVVALRHQLVTAEAAIERQAGHARAWKELAEQRSIETARALRQHDGCDRAMARLNDRITQLIAAGPRDELRRAAIADIDNVLVERAQLRGRVERLEVIMRTCGRCSVQMATPNERTDRSDGT